MKEIKKWWFFSLFPGALSTVLRFLDSAYGPWAGENLAFFDKKQTEAGLTPI